MEEISVVDVKPQLVMGIRKRGPYQQIPELLKELFMYLMSKNAKIGGPPM